MVSRERQKIVRAIRKKYKGRKLPLEFFQKVAEAFGGRCLSALYVDSNHDLEFQCKRNHIWKATGASIAQGNWCGNCQRLQLAESRKWDIQKCDEIAEERGRHCITRIYENSKTPMEWQCENGHRWWQKPKYIKTNWCKKCHLLGIRAGDEGKH